jgi:5'-3' exonuclease
MMKAGATHVAVATDHVIESFRNDLWPEYKTSEGVEPELLAQFPLLEGVLSVAGIVVWPMIEFEADDALAAGAKLAAADKRVEQVIICTPDKDLAQCVSGSRVVQLNRRTRDCRDWRVNVPNVSALAGTLFREWDRAIPFRTLATLRTDIDLFDDVEELKWSGPTPDFDQLAARLDKAITERSMPRARSTKSARAVRSDTDNFTEL